MTGQFNFDGVKEVEWADVRFIFGGSILARATGFEYGVETEKEHVFGAGDQAYGIQSGNRTPKGSITMTMTHLNVINAAAVVAGGRDIGDIEADIVFDYKPQGTRPPVADACRSCQFKGWKKAMKQNDKKDEVTLEFLYLE